MEIAKLILEYIQALIWPTVVLIVTFLFRAQVISIFDRIKSAKLPGGVSFDLVDQIEEAKQLSTKVQESIPSKREERKAKSPVIPLTEANSRLIDLGLRPSPSGMDMDYYRNLSQQDPNLALAGLRIEVDLLAKNLAKGFDISIDPKRESGVRLLRKLVEADAITNDQYQLAVKIMNVCNKAVHGEHVSYGQALSIIDSAEVLVDDYLAWLSWGFDGDWKPSFK
jgi:hypothetical protein